MSDRWESAITRMSRLRLERALGKLLHWDAALLEAAAYDEPVSVPTVHLNGGELTMTSGRMPLTPLLPRCGAVSSCVTTDPLAATCVKCKLLEDLLHRYGAKLFTEIVCRPGNGPGTCWRMGCTNSVEEGKIGCAEHEVFDVEDEA